DDWPLSFDEKVLALVAEDASLEPRDGAAADAEHAVAVEQEAVLVAELAIREEEGFAEGVLVGAQDVAGEAELGGVEGGVAVVPRTGGIAFRDGVGRIAVRPKGVWATGARAARERDG